MGRHTLEKTFRKLRCLHYGDMRLIPVDNGVHPYTDYPDSWHVPGRREYCTTSQLVAMATRRGITVTLAETSREGKSIVRLN